MYRRFPRKPIGETSPTPIFGTFYEFCSERISLDVTAGHMEMAIDFYWKVFETALANVAIAGCVIAGVVTLCVIVTQPRKADMGPFS